MIVLPSVDKLFLKYHLTERSDRAEYFREIKTEKKKIESYAESSVLVLAEHIGPINQARCRGVTQDKQPLFTEYNGCIQYLLLGKRQRAQAK